MFGQMTAGSWIYIGTQGILQGTYQTFAAAAQKHFGAASLAGRTILTAGLGGMGGAPAGGDARGDPLHRSRSRSDRAPAQDTLDEATHRARRCARTHSVGGRRRTYRSACSAMPPSSSRRSRAAASRSTSSPTRPRHDPLTGYVPDGLDVAAAAALRASDPDESLGALEQRSRGMSRACSSSSPGPGAMFSIMATTCEVGSRRNGGLHIPGIRTGLYPALLPRDATVPVGCAVGRPCRHRGDRRRPARLVPRHLQRWLELAPERVAFQGLARICWLGYGDRARAGLAINELVRSGQVSAPIVIGRDHLRLHRPLP